MPPPGNPQPPQEDVDSFTAWMENTLDAHPKGPTAGYVPVERLNRTEYAASVKDSPGCRCEREGHPAAGCSSGGLRQHRLRPDHVACVPGPIPRRRTPCREEGRRRHGAADLRTGPSSPRATRIRTCRSLRACAHATRCSSRTTSRPTGSIASASLRRSVDRFVQPATAERDDAGDHDRWQGRSSRATSAAPKI